MIGQAKEIIVEQNFILLVFRHSAAKSLAYPYRCLDVFKAPCAAIAPAVERTLGKGEVACSITLAAPFSPVFCLRYLTGCKIHCRRAANSAEKQRERKRAYPAILYLPKNV